MLYYEKQNIVKREVEQYVKEIFKVYGDELILKLEDYNLLEDENNCIKTSTAIGFVIEEFIVNKLKIYSQNHKDEDMKVKIKRHTVGTVNSSYDCYCEFKNVFFMINVKVNRGQNNAVAAINILHRDYVEENPNIEKSYMVLKINYEIGRSKIDYQNKILIKGIKSYFIEEIDFSSGHKQDNRNWSSNFNKNSGRLQITNKFFKDNMIDEKERNYKNTRQQIEDIYNGKL